MHMRLIATLLASMGLLGCGEPGSVPSAPPAAVSPALAPPALDDPQPHGYLGLDNVVLLPHMGSATIEGRVAMGERVLLNIQSFADGHAPPDRVLTTEY